MFTGIVLDLGVVRAIEPLAGDVRLTIGTRKVSLEHVGIGDSIAVNGVCLTVIACGPKHLVADVSRETLRVTCLQQLTTDAAVNLELALRVGDPLGGHFVSGHVDGVGQVVSMNEDARSQRVRFRVPPELARYIAAKGSVTIDGVSLTVNSVTGHEFDVNIIPHTQQVTTLGQLRAGDMVNVEVDQMARYADRLLGFANLTRVQGS